MKIVIVEWKDGRPVIHWVETLGLALALGLVQGTGTGCVYALLSGAWSHEAALSGAGIGVGIVFLGLVTGLQKPRQG